MYLAPKVRSIEQKALLFELNAQSKQQYTDKFTDIAVQAQSVSTRPFFMPGDEANGSYTLGNNYHITTGQLDPWVHGYKHENATNIDS